MTSDLWRSGTTPRYEPPSGRGFRIPDDAIRAVGDGDAALGRAIISEMFHLHPMQDANLDADAVREIGHGNLKAGYKILHRFAAKFRMQRARDAKQHRSRSR